MDTFMTFINGSHSSKKFGTATEDPIIAGMAKYNNTNDKTPLSSTSVSICGQLFETEADEVLSEFLNPQFLKQEDQGDYETPSDPKLSTSGTKMETSGTPDSVCTQTTETMRVLPNTPTPSAPSPTTVAFNEQLKMFEDSKEELMNIKFGLNNEAKYIHHSNVGLQYTTLPVTEHPEDPDVTATYLPMEYTEAFLRDSSEFPYKMSIADLPAQSRVETQIKLELSVSPPPKQFLLHLPRDTITKPKFTLAENTLPESIKKHLLYLEMFVIGSESISSKDGRLKSCNVCKRCMRRELKRASRRKAGLVDDSSNWDLNLPKRALIINSKEIVSFPSPSGNEVARKLELLSRIVCYCRHHQELDGFRIAIFLKNEQDEIIGKCHTTPILIMDRKKSSKSSNSNNTGALVSNKEHLSASKNSITISQESSSEFSMATSISSTKLNPKLVTKPLETDIMMARDSSNSSMGVPKTNIMSILSLKDGKNNTHGNKPPKTGRGMFSSIFSFDPSNLLGDESSRQTKRQKRLWSQSDSGSYHDSINQQRYHSQSEANKGNVQDTPAMNSGHIMQIKKEAISPLSSDAVSPHNHMLSSATSIFSATPERRIYEGQKMNLTSSFNDELAMNVENIDNIGSNSGVLDLNGLDLDVDMEMNVNLNLGEPVPTIRKIIPAQGSIRGGIEVTLLGSNFKPGLEVKFGSNISLATQCWSDSTIVTYLPPAPQAGPVLVTFDSSDIAANNSVPHQIFTYTDDTDKQLIELALQIVGLKMNGKLEDAKNIAKRIVGNNQMDDPSSTSFGQGDQSNSSSTSNQLNQQLQLNWMVVASNKIKELSTSTLNHEDILIKFLNILQIPNYIITSPNWGVCNSEGQTMLHLACLKNYSKLTNFLLKSGSRVDYRDKNGFTPVHFAFIPGNRKIITMLMKYNANVSNKLDNGILLSSIADSNVLDLIDGHVDVSRRSSDSTSYEDLEIDDTFDDEMEACGMDEIGFNSAYKSSSKTHYTSSYRNRKSQYARKKRVDDSEADDEEEDVDLDMDLDGSDASTDKSSSGTSSIKSLDRKKNTNSFGLNLWIAMREAITSKVIELSDGQHKHGGRKHSRPIHGTNVETSQHLDKTNEANDNDGEEGDALPTYDDLFPNGASLRAFINFRGHTDGEDDEKLSKTNKSAEPEEDVGDSDVDIIAKKMHTSITSDTKLMFFWLPFMLLLLLVVIGVKMNMISLNSLQLIKIRESVGSFMLGKDRFTNLLNENINYGRERMENLLHDVNGVVKTAVSGVGR